MNSISYSYDSHDTPGPVRVPEGGGGGGGAGDREKRDRCRQNHYDQNTGRPGQNGTVGNPKWYEAKCFCRSISRTVVQAARSIGRTVV